MGETWIGSLPVMAADKMVVIVADTDVVMNETAAPLSASHTRAEAVMNDLLIS